MFLTTSSGCGSHQALTSSAVSPSLLSSHSSSESWTELVDVHSHQLMDLNHITAENPPLIASTATLALPTAWPVKIHLGWFKKLTSTALQHPTSRTLIVGMVALVATVSAAGTYHVSLIEQQADDHTPHPWPSYGSLIPKSGQEQPPNPPLSSRPPQPSPSDPKLVIPLKKTTEEQALQPTKPQNYPSDVLSLEEHKEQLESQVSKAKNQQKLIDRIIQLNLELYAHKKGISVQEITPEQRMRLENEQNLRNLTQHIDELSDDNMDRITSRIDQLENALADLQTSKHQKKGEQVIVGNLKQKHLNTIWQAIGAGILFVMFF